ncbi:hypothetical protein ABBQ38_009157 [Trebouxia sp. C0009 RCD-2024]
MLRQNSLKVAEARVRALTREVGTLKEDIQREVKRRERASVSIREAEELRQEAEKRVKQLEYSKRKLEQESFTAQEEARIAAAKSRAAATAAREELAAYEGSIAEQAAASHQHMQHISHHLQKLQALLFQPTDSLADPPLASNVPLVQNELREVMHGLSHLSASLPGHSRDVAATTPHSPCRHAKPYSNPLESELQQLHAEVAMLRAQRQIQQDDINAQQAADDMSSLIPEYRSTLARMKKQVDELQLRLENACQERHSLHQQVAALKKAAKLGSTSRQSRRVLSPRLRSEASEEDEDAKRLIKDIRGLKHRCQSLEAQADALGVTNCELQASLHEREDQVQRQQHVIADLEATINAQSSDIRTALQLVTHKHTGSHSGSADCPDDLDALVPAWHPSSSPRKSALRQRSSWHQGHLGTDASFSQPCSFARNACRSPHRQQQHRCSQPQHYASMDMLCRDMQQLDAQIADLDVNLATASHRLHH